MTVVQADKLPQDGIAARRRSIRALIAATVVALALAGCRPAGGSAGSGTPSPPSGTSTGSGSASPAAAGACAGRGDEAAPTTAQVPGTKWPERRAVSPGRTPAYSGMALDPATDTAYALVPLAGSQSNARYQAVRSGRVRYLKIPILRWRLTTCGPSASQAARPSSARSTRAPCASSGPSRCLATRLLATRHCT